MIRKNYTLTLNIVVTVEDMGDGITLLNGRRSGNNRQPNLGFREREKRLYDSIISHQEVLENLCRCYAVDSVEDGVMGELRKQLDVKEDEEVVPPAIGSLSQADQKYWKEILAAGRFPEDSEFIWKRIHTKLISARIHSLNVANAPNS